MQKITDKDIPTPEKFFLETPIYKFFKVDADNIKNCLMITGFMNSIKSYCPDCSEDSIFIREHDSGYEDMAGLEDSIDLQLKNMKERDGKINITNILDDEFFHNIYFACAKNHSHKLCFFIMLTENTLVKVGQYPSIATLHDFHVKKYRKALSEKYFTELKRAIGLNAHGIGIGSFVYLRRIFEKIILETFENSGNITVKKEDFNNKKMEEKIVLLKDSLPQFLAENKSIYSILSIGIHELEEDMCSKYFNVVAKSIEIILDQKIAQEEKNKKEKEIKNALGNALGELKSSVQNT